MSNPRFKLSTEELLEFALLGVHNEIGLNMGNPDWTRENWEFHYRAEREIERRLKIVQKQNILPPDDFSEAPRSEEK